jgi:L-cystine transport system substrate-binding protein
VKTIVVAYAQNGKPTAYTDEKGNLTGYDIEALRLVNQLLPQYKFEYVGLDQPAVYAGLSTGKYNIAVTNSFYTTDRAAKYLFPKQNIGASVLGLFTNKQKNPDIKNLDQAAAKKLRIVPILAGDGLYYVVDTYNKAHPNVQVALTPTDDSNTFTEAFQWVAEGRYDFSLTPQQYWDALVASPTGDYHQYYDKLSFSVFGAVKTWTILAKGQEQLAADIDTALAQLKKDGKLSELSKKFYSGVDNFTYLPADAQLD